MPLPSRLTTALAFASFATACGSDAVVDPPGPPNNEVASVTISGDDLSFASLGLTAPLNATARNSDGAAINTAISWNSSAVGVATVSANGTVTAIGNGTAIITAAAGGKSDQVTVNVAQVPAAIDISSPATTLTVAGTRVTLTAQVKDANNRQVDGAAIEWTSSNTDVLPIAPDGKVTAAAPGSATITARSGNFTDDVVISVNYQGPLGGPILGAAVPCTGGSAGLFPCNNVTLMSYLPPAALGSTSANIDFNDLWGWVDPTTQREYVIAMRVDGAAFVDVTDPLRPRYLGQLPIPATARPNVWHDVKVYDNHAFIVADGANQHGMQVFDLTRLRDVTAPQTFDPDAHYTQIASAHNIFINEETGYAYSVGGSSGGTTCGGGLHIIDIRNPRNPTFAGCFADPNTGWNNTGYSHDVQCVVYDGPDATYLGREVCFGSNETHLSIADVTDKSAPVAISRASYPAVAYSHQGWLTADQRYFLMNDELDELDGSVAGTRTLIWDVSDLDDPILVSQFVGPTAATDHNHYISGDVMYASNYQYGIRMVDVSNPLAPTQVGFFDTAPTLPNTPGFGGSWSNYPFFPSGNIVVSSQDEGLYVLRRQ